MKLTELPPHLGAHPSSFTFWEQNHPFALAAAMQEAHRVSRALHQGRFYCNLRENEEDLPLDEEIQPEIPS